jgi:hypothetical protein
MSGSPAVLERCARALLLAYPAPCDRLALPPPDGHAQGAASKLTSLVSTVPAVLPGAAW